MDNPGYIMNKGNFNRIRVHYKSSLKPKLTPPRGQQPPTAQGGSTYKKMLVATSSYNSKSV